MTIIGEGRRSWVDLLAVFLSFLAASISLLGAVLIYASQAQLAEGSLWPLPGLVLIDWILTGVISFLAVIFSLRKNTVGWHRMTWLLTGAFIPLIILGVLSIGLLVLVSFFLAVISTFILSIRYRFKWLESFGFLMIGSIFNLGLLAIIILIGNAY